MKKKGFPVFLMLSCTLFVLCRADMQEYSVIDKALASMSKVVVKYQSEFDTRVKFAALQEAIDSIDESMLDYQGTAKNKLDQLRTLNSAARLTYENCVGPVFEWCVSINSTLDIFIANIKDQKLTKHDRDIIWNITAEVLVDGQNKTYNSIELLKLVQEKTSDLKNLLDSMMHDLHYDFGAEGFYGKQKQDLMDAVEKSKQTETALIVATVIGLIFTTVASLVTGQIGIALELLPIFVKLGLDAVIERRRQATYEEQLLAISAFFNALDEKINKASEIALQVNVDLKEEKDNLYALSGFITGAYRNRKVLLMDSPNLHVLLVPSFQDLGNQCYKYTIWHGYGSSGYKHKPSRAKRQAIKACKEQRLKALTKEMEGTSLNITFEALVAKAHSIVKEINCDPRTLPIPPQYEQAEMPYLEENAGPIAFDEQNIESLPTSKKPLEKIPLYSSSIFSGNNMMTSYLKYL